jgi:hypothetical protein
MRASAVGAASSVLDIHRAERADGVVDALGVISGEPPEDSTVSYSSRLGGVKRSTGPCRESRREP